MYVWYFPSLKVNFGLKNNLHHTGISRRVALRSTLMYTRTPLDIDRLIADVVDNGPISQITHYQEIGSTNTELVAAATAGAPAWSVIVAEYQTAGRGRMGRAYTAPPGAQIPLSILIRPPASAVERIGTMPFATGLALVDTIGYDNGARMKWPNDLNVDNRKMCGILAEAVALGAEPAIVIGLGLNTDLAQDELPVPHATSLRLEGIDYEKTALVGQLLRNLHRRLTDWENNDPSTLADYRAVSSTIGHNVRAILPGDKELVGLAIGVKEDGQLIIEDDNKELHYVAVGDVIHLRLQ